MNNRIILLLSALSLALLAGPASADRLDGGTVDDIADADVTCGIADMRWAIMDSALDCADGSGNPKKGDIKDYYPGGDWEDAGRLEADGERVLAGFLEWVFISGAWNESGFVGTFTILDGFWDVYSEAVLSFHVGGGQGDPDHFAFLLEPGDNSGTLSFVNNYNGGGFSNLVLWGRGEGVSVPEPGTMLLLGSGLLLLGASRRRRKAK